MSCRRSSPPLQNRPPLVTIFFSIIFHHPSLHQLSFLSISFCSQVLWIFFHFTVLSFFSSYLLLIFSKWNFYACFKVTLKVMNTRLKHTFFYRCFRIQTHSTFISAPVAAVFNCPDMFKIFPRIASSLYLFLSSLSLSLYSQNFAASLPSLSLSLSLSVSLFYFTSLVLSSLITSAILFFFFLQFLSQWYWFTLIVFSTISLLLSSLLLLSFFLSPRVLFPLIVI